MKSKSKHKKHSHSDAEKLAILIVKSHKALSTKLNKLNMKISDLTIKANALQASFDALKVKIDAIGANGTEAERQELGDKMDALKAGMDETLPAPQV